MPAISVFSPKGGVGKTTITVNLASYLVYQKKRSDVVLVDFDPQQSTKAIVEQTNLKNYVTIKTQEQKDEIDPKNSFVIVDHAPGYYSWNKPVKYVIVPFRASNLDMSVSERAISKLGNRKILRCVTFLQHNKIEDKELMEVLKETYDESMYTTIKNRSIYTRIFNNNMTLFEDNSKNLYGLKESREEIEILFNKTKNL